MPIKKKNKTNGKMEWYGLVKENGKQRTKKFKTLHDAKLWESVELIKIKIHNPDKTSYLHKEQIEQIPSIGELAAKHLESDKGHKSPGTINTKKLAYNRLFNSIDPLTPATKVSKAELRKFLDDLGRDVSQHTANVTLVAINRLYNWAIKLDIIPDYNPCKTLEKLCFEKSEKYIPPLSDFLKVINSTETHEDRLLLTLFYVTLARHREILNMKWKDVNFEKSTITLWTGKRKGGRQSDKIKIDKNTKDMLYIHKKNIIYNEEHYVFINKKTRSKFDSKHDLLDRLIKKANVKRFTMHGIRHLAASMMAENGESLSNIQAMCRHKNTTTTDKYIHSLNGSASSTILTRTAQELFHSTKKATAEPSSSRSFSDNSPES